MSTSRFEDKNSDVSGLNLGLDNLEFEELDPNIAEGFKIIFDKEIPIELSASSCGKWDTQGQIFRKCLFTRKDALEAHQARLQLIAMSQSSKNLIRLQDTTSNQESGTIESIKAKIMMQGELQNPSLLKIELTCDSDLFFNYISVIDDNHFAKMRDEQKLNIELHSLPNLLIKIFNNSQRNPNTYFAVMFISSEGHARLDFIQNLEYKFLELLTIDFTAATEDVVRQNIMYRYNIERAKCNYLQSKLREVGEMVKLKNPSLLLHLQKGANIPASGKISNASSFYSTLKK